MPALRRAVLVPALLVPALALAAPAHATLLVRSDGAGLLIQDKNGLDDRVTLRSADPPDRATHFKIRNLNSFDIFKFDTQTGCVTFTGTDRASCSRFQPKVNVALLGGHDIFRIEDLEAADVSVAASTGDDHVEGHVSKDFLDGADGADVLIGEEGNDTLEGEDGNDVVNGGLGADILRGNPGRDTVVSKEPSGSGVKDEIGCGGGFDFLEADSVDVVPASCEQFIQSPVGETPHVRTPKHLRVSPTGRVRVRLRCPRGTGSIGCKGRLRLRAPGGRSRRVRYSIRAGRRKTVRLRLNARAVRRLRARQRSGRRTRGVLTSTERGRKGRKTTVVRPRLRLRG